MSTANLDDRLSVVRKTLDSVGQGHVLTFYDTLDDAARASLLAEIEGVDWPEVARLVESHVKQKPAFELPQNVEPAPYYPRTPDSPQLEK